MVSTAMLDALTHGLAFAIFYTKVHSRVLRPLLATDAPASPPALSAGVRTINTHIDARLAHERLPPAAAWNSDQPPNP